MSIEYINLFGGETAPLRESSSARLVAQIVEEVRETPGGSVYHKAHKAIESITVDRELLHLKEDLSNRYTRLVYNGYWFSPERVSLQKLINDSQKRVTGTVRVKLLKGNVIVLGRKSPYSIYSEDLSTFEADSGDYDQRDAEGFIKVNSLRLRNKQKNSI